MSGPARISSSGLLKLDCEPWISYLAKGEPARSIADKLRIFSMTDNARLLRSLVRNLEQGRRTAFCVVVDTRGSTPQTPGAAMLLHADGTTEGTLGGGCVEAEVRHRALELLQRDASGLLTFDLDRNYGWDDGLICGGHMRVAVLPVRTTEEARPFAEAAVLLEGGQPACVPLRVEHEGREFRFRWHVEAACRLVIAGAGHVGAEVARLAIGLDFDVAVIDDRAELANDRRLPPPIRPVVGDIAATLRRETIDERTYVVIVTRGHKHDEQALQAVIDRPARYLGMIGSRRKVTTIFDDLAAAGVDRAKLARVYSPIGLPIGSVTVPEIAVSIVGQLIEVRRKAGRPTRVETVGD